MTKRKEQQPKYKQSETVVIKRSQINFAPYNPRKEDPEVIKYGHEIEMYTVEQGEKRDKRQ